MKWNRKGFVLPTLLIGLALIAVGVFLAMNNAFGLSGHGTGWFILISIVLGAAIIGFSVFGWWGAILAGGITIGIIGYVIYSFMRNFS